MQIGRYETERELGRGGMGIVYAARDPDGRPVAVKLLKPGGTAARERRFVREVEALTRLRHEGVVRILDAGDHHGWSYLVTELVEGESLEERLARDGALEPERAARLARDVARAVAHAHAHDVLHRDLKPSNVLIGRDGRARVIDFGLTRDATSAGSLTQSGQLLGTPGFWSPEQARGERAAVGAHSDVYGVGGVLYAALTRDPPAVGDTLQELLIATCDRLPTPASSVQPAVDRALDAICLRALAKDPADRWPSAEALADALDGWLAARGDPTSVAPPPRAHARLVAALAAAAALVVAGLGLVLATRTAGDEGAPDVAAPSTPAVAATEPPPAVEPDPGAARVAALTSRGLERLRARDLVAAGVALDEALAAAPAHAPALVGRARLRIEQDDLAGARADAERAVELAPTSADAWFVRGDVKARGDMPDDEGAMADIARALELDPDHAGALSARGWFRFNVNGFGTLEEALDDLTRSLAARPHAWTYVQRGMVHSHMGSRDEALADFAAAIELEPLPAAHYERARLLNEEGRSQEALADLDRAIELDPQPVYLTERALVRRDLGDAAGAREDRERATQSAGETPWSLIQLGDARLADGDLKGAEEAYTRAIQRDPDGATAWIARGDVRTRLGDHMNARVDFDQAVVRDAEDPRAWFGSASLRHAMKDLDGALADWERAAALDPESPWGPYYRGSVLHERGDLKGALAEYDRALARWPDMPEALASRGLLNRDLGNVDAAVADLSLALQLIPAEAPGRERVQQALDALRPR